MRSWLIRAPLPPRTRGRLLRRFGANIGKNVRVHPITVMDAGWSNLVIRDDVYVGPDCILDLSAQLEIGRGAVLAAGVAIMTHQDAGSSHRSPTAARIGNYVRPVKVGEYAFVGVRGVILADVGDGSIVGAGAVVTKPVPAGVKVVGIPAAQSQSDMHSADRS